jgi:hypothetical protein
MFLVEYLIPPEKVLQQLRGSMFSLTLMSKGEKRCGLDATVEGLSRTMQSLRVAINEKGGYCWHVYRQSVLVIDGKNKNDNVMFIGKNNNNDGMFIGRVCLSLMERK